MSWFANSSDRIDRPYDFVIRVVELQILCCVWPDRRVMVESDCSLRMQIFIEAIIVEPLDNVLSTR